MKTFYDLNQRDEESMIIPEINKRIMQSHFKSNFEKEENNNFQDCYFDACLDKSISNYNKKM